MYQPHHSSLSALLATGAGQVQAQGWLKVAESHLPVKTGLTEQSRCGEGQQRGGHGTVCSPALSKTGSAGQSQGGPGDTVSLLNMLSDAQCVNISTVPLKRTDTSSENCTHACGTMYECKT